MTVRIGITGPIGCGKSTVARWLGDLGAVVIDADEVAREVVEPGGPALGEVLSTFGDAVRTPDGRLDRAALGRIVFRDPSALRRLELIVHPAVRPRIVDRIGEAEAAAAPAVVIEAIKLVEGGLASICDEVWLVTCDPASQRERVLGRGLSAAEADARIAAQGDMVPRLRSAATRVIDSSGPPAETHESVVDAWRDALRRHDGGTGM